jgi:hypothetical protein
MRSRLIVVCVAVTACAAACGGTEGDAVASLDSSSTTTAIAPAVTDEEAALAFAGCMRGEGIDIPDPEVDADGHIQVRLGQLARVASESDQDVLTAAFEECGHFLDGLSFGFDPSDTAALEDRLVAFASCMRENGFDMPDPDVSAVGSEDPGQGPFGTLDLDDPRFQDALDVCGSSLIGE